MPVPAAPSVGARSYVLMDYDSGQVLGESNADERMEPASITKLMTAYAVFRELRSGKIKMEDKVTISEHAWRTQGSRMFVEVNTQVPVQQLLLGMIVESGNDASVALAEQIAGSEEAFASLMNHYAKSLGLNNSHFVNATGLPDANHYASARDIATLTRAIIREFPEYYTMYSRREFTYNDITQHNRNLLLWRDKSVDGVKTGHTDSAGYCLVTSAQREGMRLITVVLGTKSEKSRADESLALLNYGFRFFETHKLYGAGETLNDARIWQGEQSTVPLGLAQDLYVTVPRGQYRQLSAEVVLDPSIKAPATKGRPYGTVRVSLSDKPLTERPLVALREVAEGGLWRRTVDAVLQRFQ